MLLYPVFVSYCIEHAKDEKPVFDGVLFSFNKDSIRIAIDDDKLRNGDACWWEHIGVLEVMCDGETRQKLNQQIKNNNCGWLFGENELKFFGRPDPKKFCPVMDGDGIMGYLKR